jgi:hypothetical protein
MPAAPFELRGWWAPAQPNQRWAPVVDCSNDAGHDEVSSGLKLRKPPAKGVGTPPPFAAAFQMCFRKPTGKHYATRRSPTSDECCSTIADGEPGQSYADTPIGSYPPNRYEQNYDGRFARRRSGRERTPLQRRAWRRPGRHDREATLVVLTRRIRDESMPSRRRPPKPRAIGAIRQRVLTDEC